MRAIVVFVATTPARLTSSTNASSDSIAASSRSGAILSSSGTGAPARPRARSSLAFASAASRARARGAACIARRSFVFGDDTLTTMKSAPIVRGGVKAAT